MPNRGIFQRELLHPGYEELSSEQVERDREAYETMMATRAAAYEARQQNRTRWEAADYPYPVEVIEHDDEGRVIPSPEMMDWLHRQARREGARRNFVPPEQLRLEQLPGDGTETSRPSE